MEQQHSPEYENLRQRLAEGDILGVKSRQGPYNWAIRLVTQSPYTHTAILVKARDRWLMAEQRPGGTVLTPLSQLIHKRIPFDIFDCPVDREKVVEAAWDSIGKKIDYGYMDLLRIAANRMFRAPLPKRDSGGQVCSSLTARVLESCGWASSLPGLPAPCDVVRRLKRQAAIIYR